MSFSKKVGLFLVIILVSYLTIVFFLGQYVKKQYFETIERLNQDANLSVNNETFDTKLIGASAITAFTIKAQPGELAQDEVVLSQFKVVHEFMFGPFFFKDSSFGLAQVKNSIDLQKGFENTITPTTDSKQALGSVQVDFFGMAHVNVSIPAFKFILDDLIQMRSEGLSSDYHIDLKTRHYTGKSSMLGLTGILGTAHFSLEDVSVDQTHNFHQGVYLGETKLHIGELAFFDKPTKTRYEVSGLDFLTQADQVGEFLQPAILLKMADLKTEKFDFNDVNIHLKANNIDIKKLNRLKQLNQEMGSSTLDQEKAETSRQALIDLIEPISINIEKLDFVGKDSFFKGKAKLSFDKDNLKYLLSPLDLYLSLNVNFLTQATMDIWREIIDEHVMKQFEAKEIIMPDKEAESLNGTLEKGQLTINGKSVSFLENN